MKIRGQVSNRRMRRTVLGAIVLLGLFCIFVTKMSLPALAAGEMEEALKITRITPSGADVPAGRQVVFEFDRPVVPLGNMARSASEIPITIEPALSCQWRWLNPSSLACQLDERHALALSTKYRVTVNPGIKTEDGKTLAAPVMHSFITQRPKISSGYFRTWLSPVTPLLTIQFNQPVGRSSLEEHLYFQSEGGGRVPAKVSDDPQNPDNKSRWLVQPTGDLPADRAGDLMVEPGVLALTGGEPAIEKRKVVSFRTLPPFRFVGVQCKNLAGAEVVLTANPKSSAQNRCNPVSPISLLFSSPVKTSELQKATRVTSGAKGSPVGPEIWSEGDYSRLSETHKKGEGYETSFESEAVLPFTEYRLQAKPGSIKDEFGRPLAAGIDIRFATDHKPPYFSLYKEMSVLEKGLDTDLPIFATNLEQIELAYETLTADGKTPTRTQVLPGPRKQDVTAAIRLGIRKLVPAESGIATGRIATKPAVSDRDTTRTFIAQITPFHVHVKLGHFTTLVWVTDLQTGQPVSGVDVRIQKDVLKNLGRSPEVLAEGRTGDNGTADLAGTAKIDPELKLTENSSGPDSPLLFVSCAKGKDIALVPLRYEFQVDSEGSNHQYIPSWNKARHGHIRAWGATAQGIYKVGDTVQYKIYVRDQENRRFVQPPSATYSIKVTDPASKVVHQRDNITLSEFGAFDGEFPIPKNGAVGYYQFQLGCSFAKLDLDPLQVLVSDFTPSSFKVTTELNGKMFGVGDTVRVTTESRLHSGGPFGNANTRINATVQPQPLQPVNPQARGFQIDVVQHDEDEEISSRGVQNLFETQNKVDEKGDLATEFNVAETPVLYGRMGVESAVRDERGKSVAGRASAIYFGRDRYVGLSQEDWTIQEAKPANVQFIVVDQNGNSVPDTAVHVTIQRLEIKAARVKGAGDAYPTQYEKEWVTDQELDLTSGQDPKTFEFTPKKSGTVRITAGVADSKGREHKTSMRRWVVGKGVVVWESPEGNLLNVFAEKEEYRVGDTAKFLVQNPYPGANALITVERYGTLDRWVKKFERSTEVVEIPVLPDYLPGFYVSVMVMSPRVEKPLGPGGEDLGKPAFRLGYAKIEVKDPYKEIAVQCKTDKEVYKPRENVELEFEAHPRNLADGEKASPIELAVAVLDEAVFDLLKQKRQAFDPYQGFYHLEDLDLQNYNLLMQLIGREKLEAKGASPAAAAGFDLSMRSVFKFVSYWNPTLRLDDQGRAKVRFQLPDNLTGWRVLAMAVTPGDRMGLGEGTFKVNQSTEIRPVMPNQVLEGDSFSAGFSLMNRTGEVRTIEVKIAAEGQCAPPEGASGAGCAVTQTVTAEPYKRYTVWLPMKATGAGEIVLTAQAGDASDRDGMRHTLKVGRQRPQEVVAVHGSIVSGEASESIAFPENMRTDVSRVSVSLAPTVVGGLDGAFRYMKEYPYECWEQKLSRAVLAGVFPGIAPYLPKSIVWEDSRAVADKTLALAVEFQAPNGGMAFYIPKDDYVSPYLSAFTALAFNWLRESGYAPPAPVEEKLHKYLRDYLKRDEDKNTWGAAVADVRAVALAALSGRGKVQRGDLDRHWRHFPEMSLFGKASFLEALVKVPDTAEMRRGTLKDILSHADQSSGMIRFNIKPDPALHQVLSSSVRDNAAILLAFLSMQSADPGSADLKDIPVRLMRTVSLGRKSRDHWASTQENLFAAMAALRYSKLYEGTASNLAAQVFLGQQSMGDAKFEGLSTPPKELEYKTQDGDRGRKTSVIVRKEGDGRLYYATRLAYSTTEVAAEDVNAGIEIHREYSVERDGAWVLLASPMEIRTGELVRVDLFVSLPSERYFVVVEDPVPGGLEPVNRELATASEIDAAKGQSLFAANSFRSRFGDWRYYGASRWSFYHKELRHDSARFYSERLAPGRYYLSYTAQAIAPGQFLSAPARAEEMYDPDVFGRTTPAQLKVRAAAE